jgi:cytochrome c1
VKRFLGPVLVIVLAVLVACSGGTDFEPSRIVTGGDPGVGKDLIVRYGCGSCHQIPDVKRADGLVGPPLVHFGRRQMIAGQLSNTPDNLIHWIQDPKQVEAGTDMPDLGVSADEARNIAAYLEQLG